MARAHRVLICSLFCMILGPVVFAQKYTVTDLGTLSGDMSSSANWINSSGHVVGCSDPSTNACSMNTDGQHAFLWQEGQRLQDLGTLPGGNISLAYGINDSDEIVGYSSTNEQTLHAFRYQFGVMEDLGTLPGGTTSQPYGLNSSGIIVGASDYQSSNGNTAAVYWTTDGSIHQLPLLQGAVAEQANGITDKNEIGGSAFFAADSTRPQAFVWTSSGGIQGLGTLPGGTKAGCDYINNSGVCFGGSNSSQNPDFQCVTWKKKNGQYAIHDLGALKGDTFCFLYGANDRGQAVGQSANSSSTSAVLWSAKTKLLDLNKHISNNSGWSLIFANSINDSGQITGLGTINGVMHGYLLTPVK